MDDHPAPFINALEIESASTWAFSDTMHSNCDSALSWLSALLASLRHSRGDPSATSTIRSMTSSGSDFFAFFSTKEVRANSSFCDTGLKCMDVHRDLTVFISFPG